MGRPGGGGSKPPPWVDSSPGACDASAVPDPPLLLAARRRPTPFTPVWLMRQAGRYLPEYRALRARHAFLELARTPQIAAEVTLQPIERLEIGRASCRERV